MSELFTFSFEAVAISGLTCVVLREIILAAFPRGLVIRIESAGR